MKIFMILPFSMVMFFGCASQIPTTSSCKTIGNDDKGVYNGECRNGLAHGKGVYYPPAGGRYEGDFIDGYREGNGTIFARNGNKFSGKFVKNQSSGEGIIQWSDGKTERGSIINGKWTATQSVSNKSSEKTCAVNGDGTLTGADGTIWQLCLYGQSYKDGACIGSPKSVNWYEAMKAARENRFLGEKDWILPSAAFFKGSIHPKGCVHPNISMAEIEHRGGYKELEVLDHYWTAFTGSRDGGVTAKVTDRRYAGGYNSVFIDTLKSASDFDVSYSSVRAVFVRNAPVSDKDRFSEATPLANCNAKCLASRKSEQKVRDQDRAEAGEDFRNGGWARRLIGGSNGSGSTSNSSGSSSSETGPSGGWKLIKQYEGGVADFGLDSRRTIFLIKCNKGGEHKMYQDGRGKWGTTGAGWNNAASSLDEAAKKQCS